MTILLTLAAGAAVIETARRVLEARQYRKDMARKQVR